MKRLSTPIGSSTWEGVGLAAFASPYDIVIPSGGLAGAIAITSGEGAGHCQPGAAPPYEADLVTDASLSALPAMASLADPTADTFGHFITDLGTQDAATINHDFNEFSSLATADASSASNPVALDLDASGATQFVLADLSISPHIRAAAAYRTHRPTSPKLSRRRSIRIPQRSVVADCLRLNPPPGYWLPRWVNCRATRPLAPPHLARSSAVAWSALSPLRLLARSKHRVRGRARSSLIRAAALSSTILLGRASRPHFKPRSWRPRTICRACSAMPSRSTPPSS